MAEPTNAATTNLLAHDIHIKGTVKFSNALILDGKVDGEILSDGIVTIGQKAEVTGDIKTGSAVIHGTVNGNIVVKDRAEMKSTSHVMGDLKAARVVIEDGAVFIGSSQITSRATQG